MKLRSISLENVRSFLHKEQVTFDSNISILIGPNGGGKTNLLDAILLTLRRHLMHSWHWQSAPTPENQFRRQFSQNDRLNSLRLEKHSQASRSAGQAVSVQIEITSQDINTMAEMAKTAHGLVQEMGDGYVGHERLSAASAWDTSALTSGDLVEFHFNEHSVTSMSDPPGTIVLQYLNSFEIFQIMRQELNKHTLPMPLLSLPAGRGGSAGDISISLAGYDEFNDKRSLDANMSRSIGSPINLAAGRLAKKHRLLLEEDRGGAWKRFRDDPAVEKFTTALSKLGYDWELAATNPLSNQYDIMLKKHGTKFSLSNASSGERELLTYLFAVYLLDVRGALILIDEPELHLHPRWQRALLQLFEDIVAETDNQFILTTHSPTFVAPSSIGYISRVYSRAQSSKIVRLASTALPNQKHLFGIVNSHNNERLFFTEKVILVEGLSDRLLFERVLKRVAGSNLALDYEIVDVGGKGFFAAYVDLLRACAIEYRIIADFDYLIDVGSPGLRQELSVDFDKIDKDVLKNPKSRDGDAIAVHLEEALESGELDGLEAVWDKVRSKHRRLPLSFAPEVASIIDAERLRLQGEGIYTLRHGAIEDYLPAGVRMKDMEKLIRFLGEEGWWERMDELARAELTEIAAGVLAV